MQALRAPLDRLDVALRWLWTADENRVLRIRTTRPLRLTVLTAIAAREHAPTNTWPVVVIEHPDDEAGWDGRADELAASYERLTESARRAGLSLPVLPDSGTRGLRRFTHDLAAFGSATRILEGAVIVLAPIGVRDTRAWAADVRALVAVQTWRELGVRFVVVDLDADWTSSVIDAIGAPVALACDAMPDPQALQGELDRAAELPDDGRGAPWRAKPRHASPPARRGDAAIPVPSTRARALLAEVTRAARKQRWADALRAQRTLRDHWDTLGEAQPATLATLQLAAFAQQAGLAGHAVRTLYDEASARAARCGAVALGLQARFARATSFAIERQAHEAALGYATLARDAESSEDPAARMLAVEAYRCAGHHFVELRLWEQAGHAWSRAVALSTAEPALPTSSAPQAARALAALQREAGLAAHAEQLEHAAQRIEEAQSAARLGAPREA